MTPSRRLGRSGIEVSALGLGCWAIGGPFWDQGGWMGYGDVDDDESIRAVRRALELGVTLFDTADVYGCGRSERVLGEALAGHRDEVVLAVKFGYRIDEQGVRVLGRDVSPEAIRRSCEASLRRLRTDRIDVYQLHLYDLALDEAAVVRDTLEALIADGKVRSYSWCTEDVARVRFFAEGRGCTALPHLVNVLETNAELLALCDELDLASLARRPLGMGLLTGKMDASSTFADNDMRQRFRWNLREGRQARQLAQLGEVRDILQRAGRTVAQGALAWTWARSPRVVPLPGFKTVRQVEENVGALRFGPLSPEDMQQIDARLGR